VPQSWLLPARVRLYPLIGTGLPAAALAVLGFALAPTVFGGHCATSTVLRVGGTIAAVTNGAYATVLITVAVHRRVRGLGRRQGTGLFGLGLLVAAVTAAVLASHSFVAKPRGAGAYVAGTGLAVAACAFLPAMLMFPGAAHTVVGRLRRGFDGFSVGACLLFAAWVLVIAPRGAVNSIGFWVALLTCCMLSVAVVAGMRSARTSRATLACAGGAAGSVVGLAGVTLTLADRAASVWLVAAFMALVAVAPVLAWWGVSHALVAQDPPADAATETFAGYPVLAVPVAIALTIALYHIFSGGKFDRASVVLGVVGAGTVAVRETLGAFDVSRYAKRVAEREAQFRSLVAGSSDVIMILDHDLIVRWQSPAAARELGLSDQEVVGRHFQSMLHPEDAVQVAERLDRIRADADQGGGLIGARIRDGFGVWRETESTVSDQREVPEVAGLVVHIRDVGARREMERTLYRLEYADQLTGLANRRQLMTSIDALRSVARARGAVLMVELSGFTAVNDLRGYDTGDAVLVEVARRLRTASGGTDLVARIGGIEFAVATESSPVQAYALATRLLTTLAQPVVLPGAPGAIVVHLNASVGLTDLAGAADSDEVLRRADLALRRATQLGPGKVEWYDEALERDMLRRMMLEQDLPDALVRGELDLIYQPILDLVEARPTSVEALLRWRHPRLGTLLPYDVIPVAEEIGLIGEIGSWVLHQATRQLAAWRREGRDLAIAVNVSPRQLAGPELISDVASVLAMHDLEPENLVLEIAERGLGSDTRPADERLQQLRALGIRTALDEFGTAPDSLNHLRRLPMDMVKIGRSFFDETADRSGFGGPIIDVMVGLGRRLGIDVVAQGLEAPTHLDVVRAAGCRLGQGHLFARPQPAEHTEAYLDGFPGRAG
jgi:diguanylate cyclase (GGDEF)-like protein/PAS domain S-box-containing protein